MFCVASAGFADVQGCASRVFRDARRVGAWVFIRGGVLAVYCVATRVYQRV